MMGRAARLSFLLAITVITLGGISGVPCSAQPGSPPVRRPKEPQGAAPQVARPPAAQPPAVQLRPAGMPPGFPLDAQQEAHVDQILQYWEFHTSKIKTHECKFVRRNYDHVFGDRKTPNTVDVGTIRFLDPDKGLFRVDRTYKFDPQAADPKKQYVQQDVQFGEYWICDGQAVYQFDARTKVLTETRLPPEMQGKAIAEGPLPFLFGAKAEDMKARYWIRMNTPEENPEGQYFLEAIPKRREDAANFDMLSVILKVEKKQLFPHAMEVSTKQGRVVYEFQDHSPNNPLHRVQGFLDSFVRPSKPAGWEKVVEDWGGQPLDDRRATLPESPGRAADLQPPPRQR